MEHKHLIQSCAGKNCLPHCPCDCHMETGEAQWKGKGWSDANMLHLSTGMSTYVKVEDVQDFITQTLESLGSELAERKEQRTKQFFGQPSFVQDIVSMEDIASVFKRYGVDIGGKGE